MEDAVSLSVVSSGLNTVLTPSSSLRVALCRAMLMKVDLLLLDEPTNHLDTKSVEWLQGCTSIIRLSVRACTDSIVLQTSTPKTTSPP
jgi:ABC-type transport system involved in cytochrome bd biosynthesis fused ATPase/permease subunit